MRVTVSVTEQAVAVKTAMDRLAEAVAERTGTDVERDLYPGLQAAVAVSCVNSAVLTWQADPTAGTAAELTRRAFDLVRSGLPDPRQHP